MSTAIVWFRHDLRLDDNPALAAALKAGNRVVPTYIHAPDEAGEWQPGAASDWWLHHSLEDLGNRLLAIGSRLTIRSGPSAQALLELVRQTGATAVYWNRLYEPVLAQRDAQVRDCLAKRGVRVESHNAGLLVEPWQVETANGDPYRVFTPFWKKAAALIGTRRPVPAPGYLEAPPALSGLPLDALGLRPSLPWADGFADHWQPGETGGRQRLSEFLSGALAPYGTDRDRPDQDGTSRLSPHLHFGDISPRRIVERLLAGAPTAIQKQQAGIYIRQLGWREFSHHLLHHFPHTTNAPLNARFEDFPWRQDAAGLAAWQSGTTGIPIVDAGMRQLWRTGWMHNRVRMITASLLTKNLRIHWLEGARWFWDTLVDADLANNTQGWQWTAGSGADAAPYFRIFNPVIQGERFDPGGAYVATWIPEIARLPLRWRHQPWMAPAGVLDVAGVARDSVYRRPIVDLKASREAALSAYAAMRRTP